MNEQFSLGSHVSSGRRKSVNSLADKAYHILEEMIVTLELPPGAIISESELCEKIAIGRTPLREALQRLAKERLVSVLPRRGMIVSDVKIFDQLEVVELRRVVDRLLVSKTVTRANPGQRRQLKEIASQITKAASEYNIQEFMHLDSEFDQIVQSASRNYFASQISETLHAHCRRFWFVNQAGSDLIRSANLHAEIMSASSEGDKTKAVEAADKLSDYIEEFTRSSLDR